MVVGVAHVAAVAIRHIQHAVGAEQKLPGVVVLVGLLYGEHDPNGLGGSGAGVGARRAPLLDDGEITALAAIDVMNEEPPVLGELGVKGQAQEPLLRRRAHGDVEPQALGAII